MNFSVIKSGLVLSLLLCSVVMAAAGNDKNAAGTAIPAHIDSLIRILILPYQGEEERTASVYKAVEEFVRSFENCTAVGFRPSAARASLQGEGMRAMDKRACT